jgi:hypothetical protein
MEFERPVRSQFRKLYLTNVIHNMFNLKWSLSLLAEEPVGKLLLLLLLLLLGKGVPLQVWSGPEGSRKLRFPDYVITAQDGGKVVSLTHRPPLPPGNAPGTHFC